MPEHKKQSIKPSPKNSKNDYDQTRPPFHGACKQRRRFFSAPLSYPSATNFFTCLDGLGLGGGIIVQPHFEPKGLTLLAVAYSTNASQPQLFINLSPGGVEIIWPESFLTWTLQSTTILSSTAWTAVSNACGNQTVVPTSAPRQYFILRNGN